MLAEATGFNWSGIYVGIGGGVGAVERKMEQVGAGGTFGLPDFGGDGVFAEATAGYDYMVSERFLLGAFVDARVGNIGFSIENAVGPGEVTLEGKYGFDVAARAGYLLTPNTLGYVLGGYTWQHFELNGTSFGPSTDNERDRDGYVLGVGLETAIGSNWTLKSEYRYANYGNEAVVSMGGTDLEVEPSTHTFHVGANYRFGAQNGGGASFAAPAYSWTGFYVGGALGAVAKNDEINIAGFTMLKGIGGQGAFGELNVGYDHEFNGIWVAGLQVAGRYSGLATQMFAFGGDALEGKTDYGFDIVARVGAKLNESTLAYALGGYSWQHFTAEGLGIMGSPVDKIDWSSSGFTVGGGLETAVTNNVTVNLEYRYSRYQSEEMFEGFWKSTPAFHSVRVGAKYKFN
ncbi:outer membrane protein [Aminobacter sp. UC22_36]|uniref:outer membrane protein n=1 Tax=Aminobacter sp. UC22_36 TaxID=3374549 RepID=UPI0037575AE3